MAEHWPFLYFTNIVHYYCAHHLCHLIPLVIYYVVGFGMSFISRLANPWLLLCPFASKMLLLVVVLLHFTSRLDKIAATILLSYHFRLLQCSKNIEYGLSRLYTCCHVFRVRVNHDIVIVMILIAMVNLPIGWLNLQKTAIRRRFPKTCRISLIFVEFL